MTNLSQINWKKSDYITLGKAVSNFNKTIKKLETEENKLYLPDPENYKELKDKIKTRAELNRIVNSLKRITKKGAGDIVYLESGIPITRYQRNELSIQSRSVQLKLLNEYKQYETVDFPYQTERQREIMTEIRNLKKYRTVEKEELEKEITRLNKRASLDYDYMKAQRYMENYINELEKYRGFANYDILEVFIKKYKNPIQFYNRISDDMLLKDLSLVSDKELAQNEFNQFVIDFVKGFTSGEETEIDKELNKIRKNLGNLIEESEVYEL